MRDGGLLSAFDELATTGQCGDETVALLRSLAAQFTRTHSFPPPPDHDRWSDEAVDDLLAAMFEKKGPAFVLGCFTVATSQGALERLLLAAIRNHLIDEAKGTPRGKLRRRLETLLSADPRFIRTDVMGARSWDLPGRADSRWDGDSATLQQAAFAVRGVSVRRWNESGPTPRETVEALTTVAHAVLVAAGGAVRDEDLARVIEVRFALLTTPTLVPLVGDGSWIDPSAPTEDWPDELVLADATAEELWTSLSPTERALLPHLGKPDRELAEITETGPKAARAIADALVERLRLALVDDEQHNDVVAFLVQRCVTRP